MNPSNVLALIGDLYAQITVLQSENASLRQAAQSSQNKGRNDTILVHEEGDVRIYETDGQFTRSDGGVWTPGHWDTLGSALAAPA